MSTTSEASGRRRAGERCSGPGKALPSRESVRRRWGELFGVRWAMETVLIVLLVLFVLGGGGWGYSRWRR